MQKLILCALACIYPSVVYSFMQSASWLSAPGNRQVARWNRFVPGLKMGMLQDAEDTSDRGLFVRGVLSAGALGIVGMAQAADAKLFDFGQDDRLELEKGSRRMMAGTGMPVKLSEAASVIAPIRADARAKLAKSGAKVGKEILSFTNNTAEGADVFVGFEMTDAAGSPSLPEGFSIREVSNTGYFVRADHRTAPDTPTWITFVTRVQREGFKFSQPLYMYQVYSGSDTDPVSMYVEVTGPKQ